MLIRPQLSRGFSVIEMLIGLAIVGLLLKIALPSYRTWIQNTQIRSAAHAIVSGMQVARAQAIARNVPVQLALTSQADGTGVAWQVNELFPPNGTGAFVEAWSSAEGASSSQILQAGGGIVTYNSLGRVIAQNPFDNSAPLLQVDVTSSNDAGDAALRNIRVLIGNGGSARMCDPQLAQPDPRAC